MVAFIIRSLLYQGHCADNMLPTYKQNEVGILLLFSVS